MSVFSFSDLAILWPFANEPDRTLFVYKQHEAAGSLPNDGRAMLALAGAMGPIVMDDSSPDIYSVGASPGRELATLSLALAQGRHVIYVGGSTRNEAVRDFLAECEHSLRNPITRNLEITTHLPRTADEPRVLRVPGAEFRATYHDSGNTQVRDDYGAAILTISPFNSRYKALLVAGLHSPGTLAAARAVSRPDVSREIVRRIIPNFHLPPHVLGTVEVVVRTEVDPQGRLTKANGRELIELQYIAVNGVRLLPDPDVDAPRRAFPDLLSHQSPALRADRWPPNEKRLGLVDDLGLTFVEDETNAIYRSGDSALTVQGQPVSKPKPAFFEYFSKRDLVVISPHSDDSVIGCGGLVYYLRNRELWEDEAQRPTVYVLVMTASPRGVSEAEFDRYCEAIGIDPPQPDVDPDARAKMRSQVRRNESRGEAFVLDMETHWLDLRLDDPRSSGQIERTLETLRREAERRGRELTFLVPPYEDQHPTHRSARELVLRVLRKGEYGADVWAYESPWGFLSSTHINVILPLDRHAMFAKCQAIAMHQSQEARTRYSEVARTQARRNAEILPEEAFAFGEGSFGWDYVEVFHELRWKMEVYG